MEELKELEEISRMIIGLQNSLRSSVRRRIKTCYSSLVTVTYHLSLVTRHHLLATRHSLINNYLSPITHYLVHVPVAPGQEKI